MNNSHLLILVITASLVTIALRAVPFFIFNPKKGMPLVIKRVAYLLPTAIMGVLVIYCFKDYIVSPAMESIAAALAGIFVVVLHLWKRNTLLSIAVGTAVYMILIRVM